MRALLGRFIRPIVDKFTQNRCCRSNKKFRQNHVPKLESHEIICNLVMLPPTAAPEKVELSAASSSICPIKSKFVAQLKISARDY